MAKFLPQFVTEPDKSTSFHSTQFPLLANDSLLIAVVALRNGFDYREHCWRVEAMTIYRVDDENGRQARLRWELVFPLPSYGYKLTEGSIEFTHNLDAAGRNITGLHLLDLECLSRVARWLHALVCAGRDESNCDAAKSGRREQVAAN